MSTYNFNLFADYFQFYLQDEKVEGNLGDSWTQEAVDRLLALTSGTIGVGTVRNMDVPVTIEITEYPPVDREEDWDQINECSIEINSGKLVVAGCTDYFPDAARIAVTPGIYRARIYYGNLESLSEDGLDGEDKYKIVMWPSPAETFKIIKQRQVETNR